MQLFFWLRQRTIGRPPNRRDRKHVPGQRPPLRLEALEERFLLSTLTVLNSADSGAGSLRASIASAKSGDAIVFAHSVRDITLTSGQLAVTQSLTIDGPGVNKLTISGNDASRVFDISNGASVTIDDLTITNGATIGALGGGGVLNEAGCTLTLDHCALTDNTATAASDAANVFGGGLLNEGSATVNSSTFNGNQALGGGSAVVDSFLGGSLGGGIDNSGGATLTVTDSTFVNNQALGAGAGNFGIGGAIENNDSVFLAQPSTATISNSVFTGNVAGGEAGVAGAGVDGNGGAVDNEGLGATMTLLNTRLVGNQSGESDGGVGGAGIGGAISNFFGSTLTVSNSTLSGNLAVGGAGQTQDGGGIDNQNAHMTLSNSTLIDNQSIGGAGADGVTLLGEGVGGGIFNVNHATLTVLNSNFIDDQAIGGANGTPTAAHPLTDGALGGAIANFFSSTLIVSGGTFRGNEAVGGSSTLGLGGSALGGGIENNGSNLTATDVVFAHNQALGGAGGGGFSGGLGAGGGLDNSTKPGFPVSTASIIDSIFAANEATGGSGGAGANGGNGMGGAINVGYYALVGFTDNSFLTMSGSTIKHSSAMGGEGGSGANGGDGLGGGLAVQVGASAMVSDSKIKHNQADGGEEGAGGSDGNGVGGGAYRLGVLDLIMTDFAKNDASTSNDKLFP